MQGRYCKHVKQNPHADENTEDEVVNDDWEAEMKDSTFQSYVIGQLPLGSSPWTNIDYVSCCKHIIGVCIYA